MAGASTYEQEVLLPGPWGRDRKIYATPAGEKGRASAREDGDGRGRGGGERRSTDASVYANEKSDRAR